jgi:hypothetical protein
MSTQGGRSSVGTLRLLLVGLVVLCLGWGVLATLMVNQHASAASGAVGSAEPLSLDAQQIYQSLADADVTVSTAYLYGSQEPRASKLRYQQDIQLAADDLKVVTAATTDAAIGSPLQTLSADLPVYTGYVEDGEIYASQGLHATQHGSARAQTLAQADIGALQARGDQALNLISRSGDTDFESSIAAIQATLGTQLTAAQSAEGSSRAASSTAAARQAQSRWFAVNTRLATLDAAYQYGQETQLAIGTGQDSAATSFGAFTADLGQAIRADEATFTASAPAGRDDFTIAEFAVIALALLMAAGCARGIDQRLADYR